MEIGNITRYKIEGASIAAGALIIAANVFLVGNIVQGDVLSLITPLINLAGGLVAIVPPLFIFYRRYKVDKAVEDRFIMFITDLTEAINSGMTLPMALKYCNRRDFGVLTPHVRSMSAQVDWGIPFEQALRIFSGRINSLPVKRAIATIIETYKVGGKISDTLKAVGEGLIEINKIKAERTVSVQSQILTSYMIFFVFIFILVILQSFLIPALTPQSEVPGMGDIGGGTTENLFPPEMFMNFIIVQGFFAGLATGKMAEGSIMGGIKHSIILIAAGYSIFSVTSQLNISFF